MHLRAEIVGEAERQLRAYNLKAMPRGTLIHVFASVLVLLALSIAACGSSGSHRGSDPVWLGSAQIVVSAVVPDGPPFSILGQRYRFQDHTYLAIWSRFPEPWQVASIGLLGTWGGSGLLTEDIAVTAACRGNPFVIVHGLLRTPGSVVLMRTTGRMVRLRQVALPASLLSKEMLVYDAASAPPTELAVRTPAGELVHLRKVTWSRFFPEDCNGPERPWANAHFRSDLADDAAARIVECMRGKSFEAGAPADQGPGLFRTAEGRQFKAVQKLCRMQVSTAMATS
jgi:hypothetical protein